MLPLGFCEKETDFFNKNLDEKHYSNFRSVPSGADCSAECRPVSGDRRSTTTEPPNQLDKTITKIHHHSVFRQRHFIMSHPNSHIRRRRHNKLKLKLPFSPAARFTPTSRLTVGTKVRYLFLRASAMLKHVIDIGWTSVRLSVRLSHAGTVSKRLNMLSCFLHRTTAHSF